MEKEQKEHPLETVFDMDAGTTTTIDVIDEESGELMVAGDAPTANIPSYDDKDLEINEQLQDLHEKAVDAFETLMDESETVEGKYKARVGEVAAQFLGHALQAIKEKSNIKNNKDRITNRGSSGPSTITNNTLVVDRNTLLQEMFSREKVIELDE